MSHYSVLPFFLMVRDIGLAKDSAFDNTEQEGMVLGHTEESLCVSFEQITHT